MTPHDFNDLRCVACGHEHGMQFDATSSLFTCSNCSRSSEMVWGVPFFGQYEAEDVLGLIEITANVGNRKNFGVTPSVVEDWEHLLSAYDKAVDKAKFVENNPNAQLPFLLNRYGEWVEIARLTQGLDLHGAKVLDIGAGLGFNSHRLTMLGASVTALEFSPVLAESGLVNFPHIRWVGGLSHYLPFKSGSFDAVFCNVALHHMRDIPATISEALRVLRPGGVLIATYAPFGASESADDAELEIFDREPSVLIGVNEGVPRFSDCVEALIKHPNLLDVELYTHTLYDAPSGGTLSVFAPRNLDRDCAMLSQKNDSLAMRVRLKSPWVEPATVQRRGIVAVGEFSSWSSSASFALTNLAALLPAPFVDRPFPGTTSTKFDLLNGWRAPKPFRQSRTAFQRGRWFLRRSTSYDTLIFELKLPSSGASTISSIVIMLNGERVGVYSVNHSSWSRVNLDISKIPSEQVFVVELLQQGGGDSLEEGSFFVRNRREISSLELAELKENMGPNARLSRTVFAVIPVFNRIHFTLACIKHLKAQSYQPIQIIVSDGGSTDGTVETIRQEHPDVVVLTSEVELWWTGSMAMGIEYAGSACDDEDAFILMMNNDTVVPNDYVEKLVSTSQTYDAAVGALVVDSRDASRVLDAGEYIDWATYSFPVKTEIEADEEFCDDVDVLPGRGSLVPMRMIRKAGNVDAHLLPHYLADYEFFYRLKQNGFRLGVSYETSILAHIEETGIVPTQGKSGFRKVWSEAFSRRSMSNVIDHWRFVQRHAPTEFRGTILRRLLRRIIADLTLRTPVRPIFLPLYWILASPRRAMAIAKGQQRSFSAFAQAIRARGADVLCSPQEFPGLIRWPLYIAASPCPIRPSDVDQCGLNVEQLVSTGVLRQMRVDGWYAFETLNFSRASHPFKARRLFWRALNPLRKCTNTMAWRRDAANRVSI